MAKKKRVNLVWPAGGLNKRLSLQTQPPFTSPSLLNVRPREVIEGRYRGGSRPGLGRYIDSTVGSANAVNMLSSVRAPGTVDGRWLDNFTGNVGDPISASWSLITDWDGGGTNNQPIIVTPSHCGAAISGQKSIVVRSAPSNIDTANRIHTIRITFKLDWSWRASWPFGGIIYLFIFGRVKTGTLTPYTEGVVAKVQISHQSGDPTGETFGFNEKPGEGSVIDYLGGAAQVTTDEWDQNTDGYSNDSEHVLSLIFTEEGGPTTGVDLQIDGNSLHSTFPNLVHASVDDFDWGFGTYHVVASSSRANIRKVEFLYSKQAIFANENASYLTTSCNGTVYQAHELETAYTAVSDGSNVTTGSHHLMGQPYLQEMYIADYEIVASGTDGQTDERNDGSTDEFTSDSYDNFATGTTVTLSDTIVGAFLLAIEDVGVFIPSTLDDFGGTNDVITCTAAIQTKSTGLSWWLVRAPKVVDPTIGTTSGTTTMAATEGSLPPGCPIIFLYQDRLGFAGGDIDPHNWFLSRQGTVTDFDYGADEGDIGRAIAGGNSDAGKLAQPITAVMPYGDDYCLFASLHQLWVMRGNVAGGGYIDNVSYEVGCVYRTAWCHLPGSGVCFLSKNGLYLIAGGSQLHPISDQAIPEDLRDMDATNKVITMSYDIRDKGIHLNAVDEDGGSGQQYFIQLPDGTFWPVSHPGDQQPLSLYAWNDRPDNSHVLFGGSDGYIRVHADENTDDDSSTTEGVGQTDGSGSYMTIGPFNIGNPMQDGVFQTIVGTLSKTSADVTWSVHVGDTMEEAVAASAFKSGTWSSGFNAKQRPRARGSACIVKISGKGLPWALEEIEAIVKTAGLERVS